MPPRSDALGPEEFAQAIVAAREPMMAYAQSLTHNTEAARDLTQEALLHALSKRARYIERGRLNSWLCRIVHNLWVNGLRRDKRRFVALTFSLDAPVRNMHDGQDFEPDSRSADRLRTEGGQVAALLRRDLQRCLTQMPMEQSEVLWMVGVEGMRYGEVAALLDIPVGTVRSRLGRGRALLRELLAGKQRAPRKPYRSKKRPKARRSRGRAIFRCFIRAAEPALA